MNFFNTISSIIYAFVSTILILFSLIIIGSSIYQIFIFDFSNQNFIVPILQSAGAIIIAVAFIDVSKYMIEEEVFSQKELTNVREARETLTKIFVIIAIAVAVEGLIYIFKAGVKDIRLLIYPTALIFSSTFMVIGLGIYQKLSSSAERIMKK